MKKISYRSPFGTLILMVSRGNLVYCNWDSPECIPKQMAIEKLIKEKEYEEDISILKETSSQLDEYFEGRGIEFSLPCKLVGTDFQKMVWAALKEINYGETVSYKELAEMCGKPKSIRAVAGACGRNPISVIFPCHRVVSSNGELGGYTGGVDKKTGLLRLEQKNIITLRMLYSCPVYYRLFMDDKTIKS